MNAEPSIYSIFAVSRRLKQAREAMGWSQSELCRLVNINPQVWNNAETGDNMLSVDNAVKLYEKTGIHLHWIYCGQMDASLPRALKKALLKRTPPKQNKPKSGGRDR